MPRRNPFSGLGPALRVIRLDRGLTQLKLAERTGYSQGQISRWECGRELPSSQSLGHYLAGCNASLLELAGLMSERSERRRFARRVLEL